MKRNLLTQRLAIHLMATIMTGGWLCTAIADENNETQKKYPITDADIVLYDAIEIDSPVEIVWPEVLNFISWYFADRTITHIAGDPGKLGYTLKIDDNLLHKIISLRSGQCLVWKTCIPQSCEKDVVFTDFELTAHGSKTLFARRSYSQNFWGEEWANIFLADTSEDKVPDVVRDLSIRFKHHVEALNP